MQRKKNVRAEMMKWRTKIMENESFEDGKIYLSAHDGVNLSFLPLLIFSSVKRSFISIEVEGMGGMGMRVVGGRRDGLMDRRKDGWMGKWMYKKMDEWRSG